MEQGDNYQTPEAASEQTVGARLHEYVLQQREILRAHLRTIGMDDSNPRDIRLSTGEVLAGLFHSQSHVKPTDMATTAEALLKSYCLGGFTYMLAEDQTPVPIPEDLQGIGEETCTGLRYGILEILMNVFGSEYAEETRRAWVIAITPNEDEEPDETTSPTAITDPEVAATLRRILGSEEETDL